MEGRCLLSVASGLLSTSLALGGGMKCQSGGGGGEGR